MIEFLTVWIVPRTGIQVNINVTHRLCTDRLQPLNMGNDAAGHQNPLWPGNSPDT